MSKIKTTLGQLMRLATAAVEKSRVGMEYGRKVEKISGYWWNKKYEYAPMEYNDYYNLMLSYSPFNELVGVAGASMQYDENTEVWISLKLAGALGFIVNKEKTND